MGCGLDRSLRLRAVKADGADRSVAPMTALFATCIGLLIVCGVIGFAAGSTLGGLVAGAVLCLGVIWEMGE